MGESQLSLLRHLVWRAARGKRSNLGELVKVRGDHVALVERVVHLRAQVTVGEGAEADQQWRNGAVAQATHSTTMTTTLRAFLGGSLVGVCQSTAPRWVGPVPLCSTAWPRSVMTSVVGHVWLVNAQPASCMVCDCHRRGSSALALAAVERERDGELGVDVCLGRSGWQ